MRVPILGGDYCTGRVTVGNFKDEITMGEISKDKNTMPKYLQPDSQGKSRGWGKTGGFPQLSMS